ncbi:hypothetical protein ACHAWF_000457, partial [Thalassiosira exigua]
MNQWARLHGWLVEDGSDGELTLLYRSSRDGQSDTTFHSMCNNKARTLTIIETNEDIVLGGYSNTAWRSVGVVGGGLFDSNIVAQYRSSNNAFLFGLSGSDILSPCKMKLITANDENAVFDRCDYGPTFGVRPDMKVQGPMVSTRIGSTYVRSPYNRLNSGRFNIKEMEVFEVTGESSSTPSCLRLNNAALATAVTRFSEQINDAINTKLTSLVEFELEILRLEKCFKDEERLVTSFCSGVTEDVVRLNVSGTIMVTKRATLCAA